MMPRTFITRFLAASFFFFILMLVSFLTINLTAVLTNKHRVLNPIDSVEDLVNQKTIKYGCQDGGSTQAFFKVST